MVVVIANPVIQAINARKKHALTIAMVMVYVKIINAYVKKTTLEQTALRSVVNTTAQIEEPVILILESAVATQTLYLTDSTVRILTVKAIAQVTVTAI